MALFVDSPTHYCNPGLQECYVTQPSIMAAFGWKVMLVLARDWYFEPDAVLDRIERLLRSDPTLEESAVERPRLTATNPESAVVKEEEKVERAANLSFRNEASVTPAPVKEGSVDAIILVRRLESAEDGARKFWEIACRGAEITIRFGRIGSKGQTPSKQLPNAESALKETHRLTAEKLRRGYREITEPPL